MRTLKLIVLPLALASLLGGCAVYGPPVAYEQPYYQPAPVYAQPVYAQPVYVQPPVTFGFSYRSGRRWNHGHRY
jgi:hypothetical protein